MSLAKRDTGCPECCRRRIRCDRTQPECLKCQKRGIRCSGQGLRCRFSAHMNVGSGTAAASSRESLDLTRPLDGAQNHNSSSQRSPIRRGYRWVEVKKDGRRLKTSERRQRSPSLEAKSESATPASSEESWQVTPETIEQEDEEIELPVSTAIYTYRRTPLRPALELVNPKNRQFFSYFSENVASVMVVLDSSANGYRQIILPLACQDDPVARAVSAVAAFHLSGRLPQFQEQAEMEQQAILEKLRLDSLRLEPQQLFTPAIWATILVLLVGDTITGLDNYKHLLQLLVCLTRSIGSEMTISEHVRDFFLQQTRMFELFGFPLTNEEKGLQILSAPLNTYLDFMNFPVSPDTQDFANLTAMKDAIGMACDIYRRRVRSTLSDDQSIHLVEMLRQRVLGIDAATRGSYALVWTYFVAAAESILPEHREFFAARLVALYGYTQFRTIPAALDALEAVWALRGRKRWTEFMAVERPILIM